MNIDATRAHVDAETMAAWADRALPAEEAAAVELHLSNCDRCQEVLAAFVRSAPVRSEATTGAVVLPFWARRPVQWSAAGLAAAAALVAMIWIGRPPAVPAPESTVASASAPAELRRDKSASASVNQLQEKVTADKPASAPAELGKERSASAAELKRDKQSSLSAREERRRDNPTGALDDKAAANQAAPKKTEGRTAAVAPPPPAAAAAPVVAAPPPPAAVALAPPPPPVTVGGAVSVVTPAAPTRPAAMYNESVVTMDAISAIPLTFEIAAPEPNSLASRSALGGGGRGGGGRALTQSAGPTRWRVVGGTRVERTTDAGATWIALPIEPQLKTPLLAGAATSPLNCWLVGREGVVLVTNDGLTFRRVSVPEAVHLTRVTATDGLRALVTAIDGRTFSTIDGGLTWK